MISCTRKICFDSAHRLMKHESNCKYLHGHRYICEATFEAPQMDNLGRVIDFSEIKKILGTWLKTELDHNTILSKDDTELANSIEKHTNKKVYLLEQNPTAENIAMHILHDICPRLFKNHDVKCTRIKLYETENSYVEVSLK
ncbi:MAG: 6-carboxytetrahydropterin synthase [Rickettsiales bacterium]|nr:6-carboxytetrahydropterin synthase [Rickettsiales bacterium]